MSRRYYWLKLNSDFFEDDTIKFIEEQENGIKYSNFYLKLCLKSLKTDGKLIRLVGETLIPYDINSLSNLTGVDFDTVRSAMQLFEKIGLVKLLDTGEIFLAQINELIGSETDKAQSMRRLRAERKNNDGNNVTQMLPEIEIEKDIDIDIDIYKEKNKKKKFQKPSLEEIKKYCEEKNYNIDAEYFIDYYNSNGWKVGKNPMKDWKATIRNWNKRNFTNNKTNKQSNFNERDYGDLSYLYANKGE